MISHNPVTPLCIDLDGTLIKTDTLYESLFLLLKKRPLYLFLCLFWLFKGKAAFKYEISKRVLLDPTHLPYNQKIIDYIYAEKNNGREIWLCTAANEKIANCIAGHLNLFNRVIASNKKKNISAKNKANSILSFTQGKGFDYAGNSKEDISVWEKADHAILVDLPKKFVKNVKIPILLDYRSENRVLSSWLKELRVHQWAKNFLIFVPFLAAHQLGNAETIINCIIAFIAFSLCASSVYLLNDLLDLSADRAHKKKKYRPLASGDISILHGCIGAVLFLTVSFLIGMTLPTNFLWVLISYYIITISYSFYFKTKTVIDVTTLALLYSLRVIAGAAATGIFLSNWLLSFSMFLFFSLAVVKRVVELKDSNDSEEKLKGRGYYPSDLPILLAAGISSGYISIHIFVLYIDSFASSKLYSNSNLLYLIAPILFIWLTRIWILTWRNAMNEDPVAFAIKDRASQLMCVLILLIIISATWL
ncbi:UbiA family prenyltransferase [Sodalis sp. C49]|uniref:UbiA family prenyltransferase n=1 Tax=Sodalis sp. C49 TaxID=3228929 RepID=UPI003965A7A0